ncbi:MAG: 30S ribosomal protein S20 [bacterium]
MPIIKSAKKKVRSSARKRKLNLTRKSAVRSAVKKVETDHLPESLSSAFKAIDKATKRRVIHPRRAARMKSRLAKTVGKNNLAG